MSVDYTISKDEIRAGQFEIDGDVFVRVVRCRDCKHGLPVTWPVGFGIPDDFLDCTGELVQTWDYLNDEPEINPVSPDGFCAWGEVRVGSSEVRVEVAGEEEVAE